MYVRVHPQFLHRSVTSSLPEWLVVARMSVRDDVSSVRRPQDVHFEYLLNHALCGTTITCWHVGHTHTS